MRAHIHEGSAAIDMLEEQFFSPPVELRSAIRCKAEFTTSLDQRPMQNAD